MKNPINDRPGPLAERVKNARNAIGVSQAELSKLIDDPTFTDNTISKIERGVIQRPSEDRILKLAENLNCNRDELMAISGRVSSDVVDIILRNPKPISLLIRSITNLKSDQLYRLALVAKINGIS